MLTLDIFPENRQKFIRLLAFLEEILAICASLEIAPILNGSLAVFAYTRQSGMDVNDIDLFFPEADFPRMIAALEEKGIQYRLKEWHVLQILKEDLKIEFDSSEYWARDLPAGSEILQIADLQLKIVSLVALKELYRRGLENTLQQNDENSRIKYTALKVKYDALGKIGKSESL